MQLRFSAARPFSAAMPPSAQQGPSARKVEQSWTNMKTGDKQVFYSSGDGSNPLGKGPIVTNRRHNRRIHRSNGTGARRST
eukprot:357343-Chlamydomonas_euryale.AAC.2